MNLIQIADELKGLPDNPQTTQMLMQYANGMNPIVPPYLALGEMKRREQVKKMQQSAQAPQGTVKDQIEQSAGLMALQQLRQQQAMQQMAQQGSAMPTVPQGIPQPQRQEEPAPEEQMAAAEGAPVQMADGGLAELAINDDMYDFSSGGIIAFRRAGEVAADDETDDESEDTDQTEGGTQVAIADTPFEARSRYETLSQRAQEQLGKGRVEPKTRAEYETEVGGKEKYGIDRGPAGAGYLMDLETLNLQKGKEREQQQQELQDRRKAALWQGLIDAGEATRGRRGIGSLFGGFGRSMLGSEGKLLADEQALRQAGLKDQETMNAAQFEVQKLRQALFDKDVSSIVKHREKLAQYAKELGVSENQLLGKELTGILNVIGRQESARGAVAAARARPVRPPTPKDVEVGARMYLPAVKVDPDFMDKPEEQQLAEAARRYVEGRARVGAQSRETTAGMSMDAKDRQELNDAVENFKLMNKEYKKLKTPEEQKAAIRKFRDDWIEDNERDKAAMAKGRGETPAKPAPPKPAANDPLNIRPQ